MIIVGDIAVPDYIYSVILDTELDKHKHIFQDQEILCNLEGLISCDLSVSTSEPILYNHSSVIDVFIKQRITMLAAANNHSLDRAVDWHGTIELAKSKGLSAFGIGTSRDAAAEPLIREVEGHTLIIFNLSWHVMMHHQTNPDNGVYVNIINEQKLLNDVIRYGKSYPDSIMVVYFHWNYDLETLPFPSHRKLAKALIDAGVKIVVGTHSHCVQGGEKYKNGYIYYGLGNFFVPWYTYIGGHISFPAFAKEEVALEYDLSNNIATIHRFHYEPGNNEHSLSHLDSMPFEDHVMQHPRCKYAGMSDDAYLAFFKKYRRKKYLVPIYKNFDTPKINTLKDWLLIRRMRSLRMLAKAKLRGWNN